MSASMPGGGKSPNFELNLVPFIDLFSTLICFLLITAAWQNLESVSAGVPPKSEDQAKENERPTPNVPPIPKVELVVSLRFDRIELSENAKVMSILHLGGTPNYTELERALDNWKTKYPDRTDVTLATENRSPYKHLVQLMDIFRTKNFPDVGILLN